MLNNYNSLVSNLLKSFIDKKIFNVYILFICNIIVIYGYNSKQKKNDIMNNKILGKKICIWYLFHSFVYLVICFIWNIQDIYDYLNIIIMMCFWYLFEWGFYILNKKINLLKINKKIINSGGSYNNPYMPENIDFLYNLLGIFIYILIK
tara:strand:+ start:3653 stop:4099 length:447 start_codon:yes stop_codon:yes gene_type:complete